MYEFLPIVIAKVPAARPSARLRALEVQVCKPGGHFDNDVAFSIYDAATGSSGRLDLVLSIAKSQCDDAA